MSGYDDAMKKMFYVKMDELELVRIKCKKCGAVLEVKVSKLKTDVKAVCGQCQESFMIGNKDPLKEIGQAIDRIVDDGSDKFTLEFPIEVRESKITK